MPRTKGYSTNGTRRIIGSNKDKLLTRRHTHGHRRGIHQHNRHRKTQRRVRQRVHRGGNPIVLPLVIAGSSVVFLSIFGGYEWLKRRRQRNKINRYQWTAENKDNAQNAEDNRKLKNLKLNELMNIIRPIYDIIREQFEMEYPNNDVIIDDGSSSYYHLIISEGQYLILEDGNRNLSEVIKEVVKDSLDVAFQKYWLTEKQKAKIIEFLNEVIIPKAKEFDEYVAKNYGTDADI